jgi:hypothetical protein
MAIGSLSRHLGSVDVYCAMHVPCGVMPTIGMFHMIAKGNIASGDNAQRKTAFD